MNPKPWLGGGDTFHPDTINLLLAEADADYLNDLALYRKKDTGWLVVVFHPTWGLVLRRIDETSRHQPMKPTKGVLDDSDDCQVAFDSLAADTPTWRTFAAFCVSDTLANRLDYLKRCLGLISQLPGQAHLGALAAKLDLHLNVDCRSRQLADTLFLIDHTLGGNSKHSGHFPTTKALEDEVNNILHVIGRKRFRLSPAFPVAEPFVTECNEVFDISLSALYVGRVTFAISMTEKWSNSENCLLVPRDR